MRNERGKKGQTDGKAKESGIAARTLPPRAFALCQNRNPMGDDFCFQEMPSLLRLSLAGFPERGVQSTRTGVVSLKCSTTDEACLRQNRSES